MWFEWTLVIYPSYVQISYEILSSVIKKKNVKANFVYENDAFNHSPYDITHLDVQDFLNTLKEELII